jgi:hypothetical protein
MKVSIFRFFINDWLQGPRGQSRGQIKVDRRGKRGEIAHYELFQAILN